MKERVITLRIREKAFNVLRDYSASQGLSVNAYINSIIENYVEWFIPGSSYQTMSLPKKMVSELFNNTPRCVLETMAKLWSVEARNTILLSGQPFNLGSTLAFAKIFAKHFMHAHMQSMVNLTQHQILLTARHETGANFSYYCGMAYAHAFNMIEYVDASFEFDETTVFVTLKVQENYPLD